MFSALLAFVLFFNVVSALPLTLVARDSVDPPITNPVAGAVWHVGDLVTVTWDTSVFVGVNVTNATGTIVLGFLENDSENLMLNSPLAEGFSLFTGSQDVTVPDVPSKTDYVIAHRTEARSDTVSADLRAASFLKPECSTDLVSPHPDFQRCFCEHASLDTFVYAGPDSQRYTDNDPVANLDAYYACVVGDLYTYYACVVADFDKSGNG
ncbi:hypothetical protein EUX98_g6313 [Antrodiella citrinella]|uniref:Uncharacterized protein n=1 Tax=Antrodiella citrinella TaxID=2447956 RepID=A0A4S4MPL3_9APHY|nr:hypothetical protein EUX98_g6313 [Antrodiella citrinella]